MSKHRLTSPFSWLLYCVSDSAPKGRQNLAQGVSPGFRNPYGVSPAGATEIHPVAFPIHQLRKWYSLLLGLRFAAPAQLALVLLLCALGLRADTATVVPDGDNSTDAWVSTPLFSKVDDDIDSPDATVVETGNNPSSPANDAVFDITCPAGLSEITEANLRVRARQGNGGARNTALVAVWSATAATNVSTGTLTDSLANYASGNQTGLSISKAACDASTITLQPSTSGGGSPETVEVDAINLDIVYTAGGAATPQVIMITKMSRRDIVRRPPAVPQPPPARKPDSTEMEP